MKHYTKKRAKKQKSYLQTLRGILSDRGELCEGCGKKLPLTPSHLIPRSFDLTLIDDPLNIHLHCLTCHDLCERGRYSELLDGDDIIMYIEQARPDYLAIKQLKHGS